MRNKLLLMGAIVVITLAILVRTAWIADDAAITLRCVLNMLHGWGPNFNIDERVQGFTHPLWFLVVSAATLISGNVFAATYVVSFVCTLAAVSVLALVLARSPWQGALGVAMLLGSRAFVDFSASGLENPLSHLLLVLCVWRSASLLDDEGGGAMPGSTFTSVFAMFGLMYLTRPDGVLIVFPLAIRLLMRQRRRGGAWVGPLVIASIPVLAWTGFALFYYGSPLPNTAFAKLETHISRSEYMVQGIRYLINSGKSDPMTLAVIGFALMLARWRRSLDAALCEGCLLSLTYVLVIGGDFMSGRFLTVPLLAATIVLVRQRVSPIAGLAGLAGVVALTPWYLRPNLLLGPDYTSRVIGRDGIADERGVYFRKVGLIRTGLGGPEVAANAVANWRVGYTGQDVGCGGIGYRGLELGPGVHIVDVCGLVDPLLARLPAPDRGKWRIGHFARVVPSNYLESLSSGEDELTDRSLRPLYDDLDLVTHGPLWSRNRLSAIVRLNLGLTPRPDDLPYLTGLDLAGDEAPKQVLLSDLRQAPVDGTNRFEPGNLAFSHRLVVTLPTPSDLSSLDLSLVARNGYLLFVRRGEQEWQQVRQLGPSFVAHGSDPDQLKRYRVAFPTPIPAVTAIAIVVGDGLYRLDTFGFNNSIGHLILNRP